MEIHPRLGKRIVLFPFPLQGHLTPMFDLATILHSRGFSISVIHTSFCAPDPSSHPNFTFHCINESVIPPSMADVVAFLGAFNDNCIEPFRERLTSLVSDEGEKVACLINDLHWTFGERVARGLGVKNMVLRTANLASFVVVSRFPWLQEKGYLPLKETQLEERIPELQPIKVKDILRIPTLNPELFFRFIASLCEQTKSSQGLILNSFEELEYSDLVRIQEEFRVPVYLLGPFNKSVEAFPTGLLSPDQSCIPWLDKHAPKSVLYVSFGSMATINKAEFAEIAWGLANSRLPFLWVVRPGLVRGSKDDHDLFPDGFLDAVSGRCHIIKWAPQTEVLAHAAVGGFWTHSGWNSTLESVCEGVPMICMPSFADQMVNARYASETWKIGIYLEGELKRGEIEKIVKKLIVEEEGEAMRERAERLKEAAALCLNEGGSSYKALENLTDRILSF